MIRINLLAAEFIKKEERNEIIVLAYFFMIVVFVVLGVNYMRLLNNYRTLEARQSLAESELNKYQNIVTQVDTLEATKNNLELRKGVISALMATRLVYPEFMEEMALLLPVNAWFHSLQTQTQAEGRLAVTLDAESLDNYSIADFIATLSTHKDFTNVELGPINSVVANKINSSAFRLNFTYQKRK